MLIVKAAMLIDTYTFVKKNTVVNYNSQHNKMILWLLGMVILENLQICVKVYSFGLSFM